MARNRWWSPARRGREASILRRPTGLGDPIARAGTRKLMTLRTGPTMMPTRTQPDRLCACSSRTSLELRCSRMAFSAAMPRARKANAHYQTHRQGAICAVTAITANGSGCAGIVLRKSGYEHHPDVQPGSRSLSSQARKIWPEIQAWVGWLMARTPCGWLRNSMKTNLPGIGELKKEG